DGDGRVHATDDPVAGHGDLAVVRLGRARVTDLHAVVVLKERVAGDGHLGARRLDGGRHLDGGRGRTAGGGAPVPADRVAFDDHPLGSASDLDEDVEPGAVALAEVGRVADDASEAEPPSPVRSTPTRPMLEKVTLSTVSWLREAALARAAMAMPEELPNLML